MLTRCGYFRKDLLDTALEIFERTDYQPGVAEVLYMKAEGMQYSRDMGKNGRVDNRHVIRSSWISDGTSDIIRIYREDFQVQTSML